MNDRIGQVIVKCRGLLVVVALLVAVPASASVIVLDVKSIGNLNLVGNFYDGGEGTNSGIEFNPETLAIVDEDVGGAGSVANEPSPEAVGFSRDGDASSSVPAEFDTDLSSLETSSTAPAVNLYDGLDAIGNLPGTLSLVAELGDSCTRDPDAGFCNGTPTGVALAGLANSIDAWATTDQTAEDPMSDRSDPVGSSVAEAAILILLGVGVGLGLAALMRGRRRRSGHSLKLRRIAKGVR